MAGLRAIRKHEVAFCADVKSWAEALFAKHPEWPFGRVEIEDYGRGSNKRQDLRFFDREHDTPILCGEVKMPGTPEGRSPYDPALMRDAYEKADNIQCHHFFTWNVNRFVLFDRSKWQAPMIQRKVRDWNLELGLISSGDCTRPEVRARIRDKFLPDFLAYFASIVTGTLVDWPMPPDDVFIRSLETHLDWPVLGTRDHLAQESAKGPVFAARLQAWMAEDMGWTFDPADPQNWRETLDRAARTLCYVFCNRAIFYEALRARYPDELESLDMPARRRKPLRIYDFFRRRFREAVRASCDYEPILYPNVSDWAGTLVFASPKAKQGWRGFFVNLHEYDFREIPSDVVGRVFQKLISPEERHNFGQFFTQDDVVDVINAFCIRRAGDTVLDPACGSGSFLVRAYHRKAWLAHQRSGGRRHQDHDKTHQQLLGEIFGCDIALFPAHLATLNLASRRITEEENYPYVARRNFFQAADTTEAFCHVPGPRTVIGGTEVRESRPVFLPDLDAVVGNPPYVRQEQIPRLADVKPAKGEDPETFQARLSQTKDYMRDLCSSAWTGLRLSGRSDLHCYFWPVAANLLKEGGHFGFLTSSSWLDVEYGFALQEWVLTHFKLIAVIESVEEPWFEDARIKTAVTILQRCQDEGARFAHVAKFVRLHKPLAEILGDRDAGDEGARQKAAEQFRKRIERTTDTFIDDHLRIVPVPQRRLWEEGVKAGQVLRAPPTAPGQGRDEAAAMQAVGKKYAAGKWGRFIRAPDLYFRLMRQYGSRFVKLGEIADVKRGITSGCDAFFMPRDVTDGVLAKVTTDQGLLWRDVGIMTPCKLSEVESGKVRIVRAGDNTLHPVEAKYLRPELHSLMQVDRPIIQARDLTRVVLWVDKPLKELSGTYVAKYIRWGAKQTFQSSKSKAVPVPQRSTCASRLLWYDLAGDVAAIAFWPMAQQYRHIIPANPEGLVCNHNLFYVSNAGLSCEQAAALPAILNSTLLALFKTYYGRYAGTEGNLKTEVVDVKLLDIPEPRGASTKALKRMQVALASMQCRRVGHLVEEAFMDCHTTAHVQQLAQTPVSLSAELQQKDRRQLDDAVLELLGVKTARERSRILEELYYETAKHYRQIRIVEVQKMEQRAGGRARRFTAHDLASSIWDSLPEAEKGPPLLRWLAALPGDKQAVHIPEGKATALGQNHLLHPCGVEFKVASDFRHMDYASPEQAALVASLAGLNIRGKVSLPSFPAACQEAGKALRQRLSTARSRFRQVAASRTGTARLRNDAADLLMQWYVNGRDS